MKHSISLKVNGVERSLLVESRCTLLESLREDLNLKGTKKSCEKGECGACSVILDGELVNACLVLSLEAHGKEVLTIEGLKKGPNLHPLQRSFVEKGAIQCGYCSPGMILSAYALLGQNSDPTEEEIKKALEGNICRCTGYKKIIQAVQAAAAEVKPRVERSGK
jgi:carbon-monoxide dehydrogenase small subunit